MKTVTVQEIKTKGVRVLPDDEVTYLIVDSKPKSAIVPIDEYEMLVEALEDLEDIQAIQKSTKEETLGLDEVEKQLGYIPEDDL